MNRIEFETDVLMPHADIQMCLNNMRRLVIRVDGKEYSGKAVLLEEDGTVTIEFGGDEPEPKKRKARKSNKIETGEKVGLVESLQNRDSRLNHQSVS